MRRPVFSPSAREDLGQISKHIRTLAGPPIAQKMVDRIRVTCRLIAETPGEIGTRRPELADGLRSFPIAPYVLYFRYRNATVQVVRILHGRRDVGRLLEE